METWKYKLTAAEVANGKKVFCAPVKSEEKHKEENEESVQAPETEKKEKKVKADKPGKAPKEKKEIKKEDDSPVDIGRLDMRVGHIRKAFKHPDADSLYVCGRD